MTLTDKLSKLSKAEKGIYLSHQIEKSDSAEDDINIRLQLVKDRRTILATEFSRL